MIKRLAMTAVCLFTFAFIFSGDVLAGPDKIPEGQPFQQLQFQIDEVARKIVPVGTIIMWSGEINESGNPIISGSPRVDWLICDGQNGTPDLKSRFILGADENNPIGTTGGNSDVVVDNQNLPKHKHNVDLTTELSGTHRHSYKDKWQKKFGETDKREVDVLLNLGLDDIDIGITTINLDSFIDIYTTQVLGWLTDLPEEPQTDTLYTGYSSKHTHDLMGQTELVGSEFPEPIQLMPPYYALAFLIYVGD